MIKTMTNKATLTFKFDDTVKYEYTNLKKLYENDPFAKYTINYIYKNTKSKFGLQYCMVVVEHDTTTKYIVNVPSFYNDLMCQILENETICDSINNGNEHFTITKRKSKTNNTWYKIIFE